MSLRVLEDWVRKAGAPPARRPGRPATSAEVRASALREVEEEWQRQGLGSGEGSVYAAIGNRVSRTLVRSSLRILKADLRRRERARIEEHRKHVLVLARDAMWSHDAMELSRGDVVEGDVPAERVQEAVASETPVQVPAKPCMSVCSGMALEASGPRGPEGEQGTPGVGNVRIRPRRNTSSADSARSRGANIVQAEITRDVASTTTIHPSVGPPANDAEVIAHLECARALRGTYPFILSVDGRYDTAELSAFAELNRIVLLVNVPRTPQHNAPVEHGNAEIRLEGGLPKRGGPRSPEECAARLERALLPLNHRRLRRTRGYRTAAACDLALPAASDVCSRVEFYEATRNAVERATASLDQATERRRVEREVILSVAESFQLIRWTRGRSRTPVAKHATLS